MFPDHHCLRKQKQHWTSASQFQLFKGLPYSWWQTDGVVDRAGCSKTVPKILLTHPQMNMNENNAQPITICSCNCCTYILQNNIYNIIHWTAILITMATTLATNNTNHGIVRREWCAEKDVHQCNWKCQRPQNYYYEACW